MDKRRKRRNEVEREEGRQTDKLRWGRRLEGIMDRQWHLAQGSASTGAWYLILFRYRDTGMLPRSYKKTDRFSPTLRPR